MRKLDNSNLVGVGFFFHGGGNVVPVDGVKYLWRPFLLLDDSGEKSSAVGCKAYLLFGGDGDSSSIDDEGGRQRR